MIEKVTMIKPFLSKVDYFNISVGDPIIAVDFEQAEKGSLSYYKCHPINSSVIHYMFEHELRELPNEL